MAVLPPETIRAAVARQWLYAAWPDAREVSLIIGTSEDSVAELRRQCFLMAVWVHELGEYRFPTFQFVGSHPVQLLRELLSLLPAPSGSGWEWIEWCVAPNAYLSDEAPADLLRVGRSDEVLDAALKEYCRDPDASW